MHIRQIKIPILKIQYEKEPKQNLCILSIFSIRAIFLISNFFNKTKIEENNIVAKLKESSLAHAKAALFDAQTVPYLSRAVI